MLATGTTNDGCSITFIGVVVEESCLFRQFDKSLDFPQTYLGWKPEKADGVMGIEQTSSGSKVLVETNWPSLQVKCEVKMTTCPN